MNGEMIDLVDLIYEFVNIEDEKNANLIRYDELNTALKVLLTPEQYTRLRREHDTEAMYRKVQQPARETVKFGLSGEIKV